MERLLGQLATTTDQSSDADALRMALGYQSRIDRKGSGMSTAARRRSILTRAVELDVIPQLLVAQRTSPLVSTCLQIVTESEVAELVATTLAPLEAATSGFVREMLETGVAPETLYLDLLTPAARKLGEMWTEDECDFTEVTIGVWRLWNAMRELSPVFLQTPAPTLRSGTTAPRALLVPLPGEQHSFGLSMVFDFFRRAGWNAWTGPIGTRGELASMVRGEWVDVVGFSLSCDERLDTARAEIRAVRKASRNPGLGVMVGGPPFVTNPGLAASIGADGTALDGLQAVSSAQGLLRRHHERQ